MKIGEIPVAALLGIENIPMLQDNMDAWKYMWAF